MPKGSDVHRHVPVDNVEVGVIIGIADVTGLQPAVFGDHVLGGRLVVVVSLHDLRSAHPDLATLVRPDRLA
jgi:hypothetical protein